MFACPAASSLTRFPLLIFLPVSTLCFRPQFKYLEHLLLFHGALSYRRISLLILYSFYKNITISLTHLLFAWNCGFSGQVRAKRERERAD